MDVSSLPALNAVLNAASAAALLCGWFFIRRKLVVPHAVCMLTAFSSSTAFLASYLIYHARVGHVRFLGTGWIRPVYFVILISHTVLAAAILPLVAATLFRASRREFHLHARVARWTLPAWLYVSVTGIVIFLLVYKVYGGAL